MSTKVTNGLDLQNQKIVNLADPTSAQDAATRAFVLAQITALINSAPGVLDTLGEIATALQSDESTASALATTVAGKVALSLFDAYTVLAADVDNTPAAVTLGAGTVLGRRASGGIVAVTNAQLLSDLGATKKYAAAIGDGAATSIVVNHALNSRDVSVDVYEASGSYAQVICDVQHTDANNVTCIFATAPAAGAYRVVVVG